MDAQFSLFDIADPSEICVENFDSWLQDRAAKRETLSPPSASVYRSMWKAFAKWANESHITWSDVNTREMARFLATRDLDPPQQRRYLWLITEIAKAKSAELGEVIDTISHKMQDQDNDLKYALARHHRKLPQILGKHDLATLFRGIAEQTRCSEWRRRRDAVMIAKYLARG